MRVERRIIPSVRSKVFANPKPSLWVKANARIRGLGVEHFVAVLRDEYGNVKEVRSVTNTVTTSGKNGIADQILLSPTLAKPTHMAVGTGTPAANALGVELDRNAFTSKLRANAVITVVGDWAAGDATGAITEAGWFDAASAGQMWVSASFAVVNKGAADTLQISWTLTIA